MQDQISVDTTADRVARANSAEAASDTYVWDDVQDFVDAERGLVAGLPDLVIADPQGRCVWDSRPHDAMLAGPRAGSVHPSLWRMAQLNNIRGLFHVAENVWQVRGHSLANMTFIAGETGWIVIDPSNTVETATVGLELVNRELGEKPVVAVIYSHTHSDHWGGVKGVDPAGSAEIIAPEGFTEFVLAESLVASEGLGPRNNYMYGELLPSGPCGHVDCGLGKAAEGGRITFSPPTDLIPTHGGERTIDGVRLVFQFAPGEAPVGMHVYIPDARVLHMADNCYACLHNIYTIRGSLSRDATLWSASVNKALAFEDAEVVIGGHHWPRWGAEVVKKFISEQRDALKYLHDQTVRHMKLGYTGHEIANIVELPDNLARQWHLRGYYGHVAHNVRGIINHYLGWYDGNPATLHPLPPRAAAEKFISYMGGVEAVLARASEDLETGACRWVAQVVDLVLWADPENNEARKLAATAHRELGFLAENATWRNAHLSAAQELTDGLRVNDAPVRDSSDLSQNIPASALLDYLGVRIIPSRAGNLELSISWHIEDRNETFFTTLRNAVLTRDDVTPFPERSACDVTVSLSHAALSAFAYDEKDADALDLDVKGDIGAFHAFANALERFPVTFPIASHALKKGEL